MSALDQRQTSNGSRTWFTWDSMYLHRFKIGVVGKEMRLLRHNWPGDDDADAPALLAVALACGSLIERWVKRSRLAPSRAVRHPRRGSSRPNTRFDLYRSRT